MLWYYIIADKATDVSHHEQLSLSIRGVDNITVCEDTDYFSIQTQSLTLCFMSLRIFSYIVHSH